MTYANITNTDILMDRFGYKVAGQLAAGQNDLPYDITERLRAARVRALSQRKLATQPHTEIVRNGGASAALTWGAAEGLSLFSGLASLLPLVALVIGLTVVKSVQDEDRVTELAAVDTALLTDELPPQAYADKGFAQFLKYHQ